MALDVDASALLVYRAALAQGIRAHRGSVARLQWRNFYCHPTHAQDVIDKAVQLHGGDGVAQGGKHCRKSLSRDSGAEEFMRRVNVQKVVIAAAELDYPKGFKVLGPSGHVDYVQHGTILPRRFNAASAASMGLSYPEWLNCAMKAGPCDGCQGLFGDHHCADRQRPDPDLTGTDHWTTTGIAHVLVEDHRRQAG